MPAGHAVACAAALAAASISSSALAQLPAFPGADGAARTVTGGRGGIVYHVTSLAGRYNDPNRAAPGTLIYGLTDSNFPANTPRTIVFDVGGTIDLGSWDTQSRINFNSNNVTIAGQTAPGGIRIMGGLVKAQGNNIIARNLTLAPGYGNRGIGADGMPDSYVYDAIDISGTNLMFDHISAVFATDETVSANELANNITIQYSNLSQGQNYPNLDTNGSYTGHAFGSLFQMGSGHKLSVHHNLYAHQKGRLPRVGSSVGTGAINDFRNNVFYNWLSTAGTGGSGQPSFNNFVGNFFLAGPGGENAAGGSTPGIVWTNGGTSIFNGNNSSGTRVHHSGNLKDTNKDGDRLDGVALANSDFGSSTFVGTPYDAGYVGHTQSATAAYDYVLNYVGANWWTRDDIIDTVDERIIHETRTGTGQIIAFADNPSDPNDGAEWYAMLNTPTQTRPAGWDTDGDGMPDAWEIAHAQNPLVANNNADFDNDGYTDLEEYLNDIAAWPAPTAITFNGGNNRYAIQANWNLNWQPSRFDTVLINSGVATVDAVGQHAGTLQLGVSAGTNGTLNVTSGWINVANVMNVGPIGTGVVSQTGGMVVAPQITLGGNAGASGTYNLSGGKLRVGTISAGSGGQFSFTGGVLSADTVNLNLVNNGGTIAPGDSPGHTQINGSLAINSGTLQIELTGTTRALQYDAIDVTSSAQLGGTLHLNLLDGFVPDYDDAFVILTANSIDGSFTNANAFGLFDVAPGAAMRLTNTGTQLVLDHFITTGDINHDGTINNLDIAPFVALLTGGGSPPELQFAGDVNGDGTVNNLDIAPFVALLTGGRPIDANDPNFAPLLGLVPEPATLALLAFATLPLSRRRRI